jgi:dienelactone hydrolase
MDEDRMTSTFGSNWMCAAVLSVLLACAPWLAHAQTRFELRPLETVTLSTQQLLLGEKNGTPVMLAEELRIPKPGTDRLPAVILMHSAGAINPATDQWAQEFNNIGIATLMVDSFSGRGFHTPDDQSKLAPLPMMIDAYRALESLALHPRIDPSRIAVMGFSKGATAAVYSSNERFRKLYGPPNAEFAAHIGLYTPCYMLHDDDKVTGKPIRLFHGVADDLTSIEPCRAYVQRLKAAGVDVALAEYPDTYHAYDFAWRKEPFKLASLPVDRNCSLVEGDGGQFLNSKTGKLFDPKNDPCMEKGATLAYYNEEATVATTKAVKEFLVTIFHLKQ